MSVLTLLIGISLVVIALVIWLFFRMSQTGQFEDMETPAQRILLDDDRGQAPPPAATDSASSADRQAPTRSTNRPH
ncbi:MAG: Cytochrome oxidase maturation protein cbb3-type [Pseudomonadota bacterium]|jgi:cbb3-type cytochrome oxidase maturation protein